MSVTKTQCHRQVVKIAENNIELQYYLYNNQMQKIVISEFSEAYGQSRITAERVDADAAYDMWANLDVKELAAQVTGASKEVLFFEQLQTVMDAEDGTIIDLM